MISVVVPAFNEEKYIENCLIALCKQTINREKYEIIVVDGESADNTVNIAKKYADKVLVRKEKGVGDARNSGVRIAKGDIIATTDADVIVPSNWLEKIEEDMKKEGVIAVFGPQKPQEEILAAKIIFKLMDWSALVCYWLGEPYIGGPNFAFKKRFFDEVGGYSNIHMSEDIELGFKLKRFGKILYNRKLVVSSSARRFMKYGYLRTIWKWKLGELYLRIGRRDKIPKDYFQYEKPLSY